MREVSFGQYYPSNSFIHKCDPRAKILFLALYITCIFLCENFYGLLFCALAFFIVVLCAKLKLSTLLQSVKAILFLLLFTSVLNLFFHKGKTVVFQWWIVAITKEGIYFTVFLAVRLFLLVLSSSLLTLTTSPVALTDGVESLLTPLKWIGFPVHVLALIMSLALRFIPILTEETNRIMNAQKARGADFERGGLVKRVKAILPILIPLLISALRRAGEVGDAMDSRCYWSSKIRIKYKKLTFGWRDLIVLVFSGILLAGVILIKIYILAMI